MSQHHRVTTPMLALPLRTATNDVIGFVSGRVTWTVTHDNKVKQIHEVWLKVNNNQDLVELDLNNDPLAPPIVAALHAFARELHATPVDSPSGQGG